MKNDSRTKNAPKKLKAGLESKRDEVTFFCPQWSRSSDKPTLFYGTQGRNDIVGFTTFGMVESEAAARAYAGFPPPSYPGKWNEKARATFFFVTRP